MNMQFIEVGRFKSDVDVEFDIEFMSSELFGYLKILQG